MEQISFTFGQGVGSHVNISIPIINDNIIEATEFFSVCLSLATVGGGISVSPNETNVFIMASDGKYIFDVFSSRISDKYI